MKLYDTLIVGGGPAGLAAAVHLAWHERSALVIDRASGPLYFTLERLWNVPGFEGATGVEIQKRLRSQARDRGAELARGNVVRASGALDAFRLESEEGVVWTGRTVLLATGVARYHPTIDGDFSPCFQYAGKGNLYYCPDCEAPEIRGRKTLVLPAGSAAAACATAIGLSRYSDRIELLLPESAEVPERFAESLDHRGVMVHRGELAELEGERRELRAVHLKDGQRLAAEAFFVASPARGRTDLAEQLGVELAPTGHHAQVRSQRGDTNVPGVWVAGDLRPMTQQVSVALGTGNLAAVMIDQFLRRREVAPPREASRLSSTEELAP